MTDEITPASSDLEVLNATEEGENTEESPAPVEDEGEETPSETESDSAESEETPAELPEEEEEKPEELLEEQEDTPKAIRFKDIKEKYPTIFKEFPELRANYFKAEQYGEVFPTVDAAKEAAGKAEFFDQLSSQASVGDLGEVLSTVGNNNPKALETISEKILPQLYNLNPQLYIKAINPEIKRFLQTAWRSAKESKNENLANSVGHLAQFLGLDKSQPQTQIQADPEKEELRNQLNQRYSSDIENFNNSVFVSTGEELAKMIRSGINPKDFNGWQADKLTEDTIAEVINVLKKDGKTQKQIQYLFLQAQRNGLSEDSKASIVSAYLAGAKMIIPQIRQRILMKAKGQTPQLSKKINVGQGSAPGRTQQRIPTRKEIREKGMSDLDILNY